MCIRDSCYPFNRLKSPQITLLPLCCLLAMSCFLHCSVFKVQLSDPFQGQIEMLTLLGKHFDLILWWRLSDSNR